MLTIVAFKWNSNYAIRYTAEHANVMAAMVARNCSLPHRFVCITDDPTGVLCDTHPLWDDASQLKNASGEHLPSCYRRLKLFDPATQKALGVRPGEAIVSIDLDTVIVDDIAPLIDRPDDFLGWSVPGSHHRRVFNGSMFMIRHGAHSEVWSEFDPETSPREAAQAGFRGSDQAWMSYRLAGHASGWTHEDGVVSFAREGLGSVDVLPSGLRVIMFHGYRKPWDDTVQQNTAWVLAHWRMQSRGSCLILGTGESVWRQAERALARHKFSGVVASPEAAKHWPGHVDAIVWTDEKALRRAIVLGFDKVIICGGSGGAGVLNTANALAERSELSEPERLLAPRPDSDASVRRGYLAEGRRGVREDWGPRDPRRAWRSPSRRAAGAAAVARGKSGRA